VSYLKVRQTKSLIGVTEKLRVVVKGLGLRGPGSEVTVANTPSFRGMVKKVIHLVKVDEVEGSAPQKKAAAPASDKKK
jgi:large subunit ribosomal protein L30